MAQRDCDSSTRVEAEEPQNGCLNEAGVLACEMRRVYVHLLKFEHLPRYMLPLEVLASSAPLCQ